MLVALAMVAVTPMTVAVAITPTVIGQTGVITMAAAFAVVAVVLALFVPGYLRMSREIDNPGAFYAFVARGLHPAAGVAAALVALVSYGALLVGLVGVIGQATAPLLEPLGVQPHWAVTAVVAVVLVTGLSSLKLSLPGVVVLVALLLDVVWIVVTAVVLMVHPAEGTSVAAGAVRVFSLGDGPDMLLFALLPAFLGFVGFEITVVYRDRARNERTVPRATVVVVATLGVLYVLGALAQIVATGPDGAVAAAREHGPELVFVLAEPHLGSTWVEFGRVLFGFGVLAAMISFTLTVAMYAYGLARDGVLPSAVGRLSPRTQAPVRAAMALLVLNLLAICGAAYLGLDPVGHLLLGGGAIGALGVLTLLAATAVAVVVHRRRTQPDPDDASAAPAVSDVKAEFDERDHGVKGDRNADGMSGIDDAGTAGAGRKSGVGALAVVAAVTLVALLVLGVWRFDALLDGPVMFLRWSVPIGFVVVAVTGVAYGLWLRRNRPGVYDKIGGTGRGTRPVDHGVRS
jgi:amino acid transporter